MKTSKDNVFIVDYELAQWEENELQSKWEYLEEQGEFGR